MELATLDMPKEQALDSYREYAAAVKRRHSHEDEVLKRAYRAIAKGRRVIDLATTIARGGVDELHRPRLAVLRADFEWCHFERTSGGGVEFKPSRFTPRAGSTIVRLPEGTLPALPAGASCNSWNVRAMVPSIPPRHRPAGLLGRFHILWEAEWTAVPPVDPALLKHLDGNLYVLLATWDLSPLERAVLGGARRG